jgi:hypothetical protein
MEVVFAETVTMDMIATARTITDIVSNYHAVRCMEEIFFLRQEIQYLRLAFTSMTKNRVGKKN